MWDAGGWQPITAATTYIIISQISGALTRPLTNPGSGESWQNTKEIFLLLNCNNIAPPASPGSVVAVNCLICTRIEVWARCRLPRWLQDHATRCLLHLPRCQVASRDISGRVMAEQDPCHIYPASSSVFPSVIML
jgi:hypothetical protein